MEQNKYAFYTKDKLNDYKNNILKKDDLTYYEAFKSIYDFYPNISDEEVITITDVCYEAWLKDEDGYAISKFTDFIVDNYKSNNLNYEEVKKSKPRDIIVSAVENDITLLKQKTFIKYDSNDLKLVIDHYNNNGRLYLGLESDDSLFEDITINLPDVEIPGKNYVFLNSNISSKLKNVLIKENLISDTLISMPYNLGFYDMVEVNFDKLKEYDNEAFLKFEKQNIDLNEERN